MKHKFTQYIILTYSRGIVSNGQATCHQNYYQGFVQTHCCCLGEVRSPNNSKVHLAECYKRAANRKCADNAISYMLLLPYYRLRNLIFQRMLLKFLYLYRNSFSDENVKWIKAPNDVIVIRLYFTTIITFILNLLIISYYILLFVVLIFAETVSSKLIKIRNISHSPTSTLLE